MLTADHVLARRRGDQLYVTALDPARRLRARNLATDLLAITRGQLDAGSDRQSLLEAYRTVTAEPRDRRLASGLQKLILDRCTFSEDTALDPATVRATVFALATEARRHGGETGIARATILAEAARTHETTPETIEQTLFADLPSAHALIRADLPEAERLIDLYEEAQVQAVLLRAVRVTATVQATQAEDYRFLFRKLKFLQLLFTLTGSEEKGYRIEIDGPYSLFESLTRYGLRLAMALPAIKACSRWSLTAEIRWGKTRQPLQFRHQGRSPEGAARRDPDPGLPDPVAQLLERLRAEASPWQATPSTRILTVPGLGVCIPDLELRNSTTAKTVYFEMLGFWSREAVWRRIELARAGLQVPIVFGVSKHLRVSEEVLPKDVPAALYVFARTPSARALLERIEAVSLRNAS